MPAVEHHNSVSWTQKDLRQGINSSCFQRCRSNKDRLLSAGSPYYDNVRPLCYSDSDAVLLCFDISRPDTVDSALKKVFIYYSQLYVALTVQG